MLPYYAYNIFGTRAHKRLDGECVFGQGISVGPPHHGFPESSPQLGFFVPQAPLYNGNNGWSSNNGGFSSRPLVYPNTNCFGYTNGYGSRYLVDASGTEQYRRNLASLFSMKHSTASPSSAVHSNYSSTPLSAYEVRSPCPIPNPHCSAFSWHQKESPSSPPVFQPISSGSNRSSNAASPQNYVDLNITNLDQKISNSEMKIILHDLFSQHITVSSISLYLQGDGNTSALIRVPSQQDAQMAIAKLQRTRVGQKRINITYANIGRNGGDTEALKKQVAALLQEVPDGRVSLYRFLEMFEARYGIAVSISELNRLKDLVTISLDSSGRTLSLNIKHRHSPTFHQEVAVYCVKHFHNSNAAGWADKELPPLPRVMVSLKEFINNIVSLIESHRNALPLASVYDCYQVECGELPSGTGVPLEHLVTCCPSRVELAQNSAGVNYLRLAERHCSSGSSLSASRSPTPQLPPTLMSMLHVFSREIVDLLKVHPGSQLPFHKFIPAYHHHFRRQCRVSSYGFIRLIELLEAVPSVVQVLGEGDRRMVTLTHRAQMRRFCTDVCTVIKAQPSRCVTVSALPELYYQVIGVSLNPLDYGVCYLADLIDELAAIGGGVTVTALNSGENLLALRHRTTPSVLSSSGSTGTPSPLQADIMDFITEVIELLGLDPQLSIRFSKFVPAYHHHFGYQCRVADFGFTKLIELFEAIPHIVEIDDCDGEKKVTLTLFERVKVASGQIASLVWSRYPPGLPLSALNSAYLWRYGTALKPGLYGANSIAHLVDLLPTIKTVDNNEWDGPIVVPVESEVKRMLGEALVRRLLSSPGGCLGVGRLRQRFAPKLRELLSTPEDAAALAPQAIFIDSENRLSLTPVYQQIKKLYEIVNQREEKKVSLGVLKEESALIGVDLCGHSSLADLITANGKPFLALRGKGPRLAVHILQDEMLPAAFDLFSFPDEQENPNENLEDADSSSTLVTPTKWQPTEPENDTPLEVPICHLATPPASVLQESMSLLSPFKGLLPAYVGGPLIAAPHPSLLPRPDLPPVDLSFSKRKLKLAPHFASPLSKG